MQGKVLKNRIKVSCGSAIKQKEVVGHIYNVLIFNTIVR